MNICHVILTLDPAAGGPPAVVLHLAEEQARLGHEVTILSQEHQDAAAAIDDSIAHLTGGDHITFHRVPLGGRITRLQLSAVMSQLDELLPTTDLVHLHGLWEPMLLRVAWRARRCSTPYFITPHGMLDPWSLSQKRLKKKIALFCWPILLAARGRDGQWELLWVLGAAGVYGLVYFGLCVAFVIEPAERQRVLKAAMRRLPLRRSSRTTDVH